MATPQTARLPDGLTGWLSSVLSTYNYGDPKRVFRDITQTLSIHTNLHPSVELYSAEPSTYQPTPTLKLHGTIHVTVRDTLLLSCPLAIWIPHNYPMEVPVVLVTLPAFNSGTVGDDRDHEIVIRPSQYVGWDGKVQHPYLLQWGQHWDKSSLSDFLEIISDVFAKEPPLKSKHEVSSQNGLNIPLEHPSPIPPPVPPPPAELLAASRKSPTSITAGANGSLSNQERGMQSANSKPPPRPLKITEAGTGHGFESVRSNEAVILNSQRGPNDNSDSILQARAKHQNHEFKWSPGADNLLYGRSLPPVPLPFTQPSNNHYIHSQPQQYQRFANPPNSYPQNPQRLQASANHGIPYNQKPNTHVTSPHIDQKPSITGEQQPYMRGSIPPQVSYTQKDISTKQMFNQSQLQSLPQHQSQRRPPPPDLLSSPLDVTIPFQQSPASQKPISAPPIPPNPEKDALTSALSTTLRGQLDHTIRENLSAIAPLVAQNQALRGAHARLQAEMKQLDELETVLSSNEKILRDTTLEADRTMEMARRRTAPEVDAVLVAPTVVGNQLYGLCAEEAALRESLFVLAKGMDRGRMETDVFVKHTRNLAREQFLKKALIKKIGRSLGMDETLNG